VLLPYDLHRPKRWSPLPPLVALVAGGWGASFLRVVRVRVFLLWCVVGVVGATSGQIKLSPLHSHIDDDLHGGVSELMATCARRSFRSTTWSSRRSSDLARSISRCIADLRWRPGRGGFSGARLLVRRWWICRSSLTTSTGGDGSWSKKARGRPLVDVPHCHVPRCVQ
jgi:hypothetical protein